MDYEGICEDLLEMEHKAGFYAAGWLSLDGEQSLRLLTHLAECREFRHELFIRGHGHGGY